MTLLPKNLPVTQWRRLPPYLRISASSPMSQSRRPLRFSAMPLTKLATCFRGAVPTPLHRIRWARNATVALFDRISRCARYYINSKTPRTIALRTKNSPVSLGGVQHLAHTVPAAGLLVAARTIEQARRYDRPKYRSRARG